MFFLFYFFKISENPLFDNMTSNHDFISNKYLYVNTIFSKKTVYTIKTEYYI